MKFRKSSSNTGAPTVSPDIVRLTQWICEFHVLRTKTAQSSICFQNTRHVLITERVVQGLESPGYWMKGDGSTFWAAWAAEEEKRPGPGI